MNSWRDVILKDFIPNVCRLTIVADPDALLTEEKLALSLKERGFDIIEFNDTIEFRFAYESRYRNLWDQGLQTDLVVILRLQDSEVNTLPYDLLQTGRRLSFDLGRLFPDLSYPIIEKLDRTFLDKLYDAQHQYSPGTLGDNATKDFILSHVFGIALEVINNEVDLLRMLLRIHYNSLNIPANLNERLIQILNDKKIFTNWPLVDIIPNSKKFFLFLQERWPVFLEKNNSKITHIGEDISGYEMDFTGPINLPFDHQDILVYIDNLFVEGKLIPVSADNLNVSLDTMNNSWIKSGIQTTEINQNIRIDKFLNLIRKNPPSTEFHYTDWISFALKWAELASLIYADTATSLQKNNFLELDAQYNEIFSAWLSKYYSTMINLPPTKPAMLHHLPRKILRDLETSSAQKAALIVLDGLALDQWMTFKQILTEQLTNTSIQESAIFAWIPTLTSVSRQAIFSAKSPFYFTNSINTTNREPKLWQQFWENNGVKKIDIVYKRGLGDGNPVADMDAIITPSKTKVIGLVVDKVDKIMHGMQLGTEGMHNQIKQWGQQGYLAGLIECLLGYDFQIWLTSDHGNIECTGKGRPSENSIAEIRGERARVYPTNDLRTQVMNRYSFGKEWDPVGLPADYFPLIAEKRDAFIRQGDTLVGHGGASIEEVMVPLIKIERS